MVRVIKKRLEPLSKWLEEVVRLPAGIAAVPGPITLHPYQRAIADALADPKVERVSVLKSSRVGFTTTLVGAIAHYIAREPSPILVLMPTQDDARGLMIDDIEGLFNESPELVDHLPMPHPGKSDRNTLTHRIFKGGSLRIVAAGAPRMLRRVSARVLLIDEVDAVQESSEGNVVALATQRTLSWGNRKIVAGGTPLNADTSVIARLYAESDQRVWELPCPSCGAFAEITWQCIEWPEGDPSRAAWRCPNCRELVQETHKAKMASRGRWCVKNIVADGRHSSCRLPN
jgi:phage terminase large subunit GpA-like protein